MFRKCILADLKLSVRLKATGLEKMLYDTVKYSFAGEPFVPPASARALLDELISPEHSLCRIKVRGKNITYV
jgi:hypothetical protein